MPGSGTSHPPGPGSTTAPPGATAGPDAGRTAGRTAGSTVGKTGASTAGAAPPWRATIAAQKPYWQRFESTLYNPDTYIDAGLRIGIVVFIGVVAWLITWIGRKAIRRLMRPIIEVDLRRDGGAHAAYYRTLSGVLLSVLRFIVYFTAFILILGTWNIQALGLMGTALGTAGILGVVVGFGAQKLVRDLITGIFILVEGQYYVGDTVTIGAITGVVQEVGIRVTRLRDEIGRLILIPNGDVSQVINHSRGRLEAAVEIGVAPDQAMEPVRDAVKAAGERAAEESGGAVAGEAVMQGITAMDGTKITLRVVAAAAPGQQKAAEMAIRSALRDLFQEREIKLI